MVKSTFAFGQRGGYYFECPSAWKFQGLPAGFQALHADKKIASVYSACMGAADSYIVSYKGIDGLQYIASSGIPESLRAWLYEKDSAGSISRNLDTLSVTLGPYNESWFASDGSQYRWSNLPTGLSEALESRRKEGGGWSAAPRLVSLGVGGNYIMLTDAGGGAWNLSNYQLLDQTMDYMKAESITFDNMETVSLNAYRLQNTIFQFKTGITCWASMQANAEEAATEIDEASEKDAQKEQELKDLQEALESAQLQRQRQLQQMQQLQQQQMLAHLQAMRRMQNASNIGTLIGTLAGMDLAASSNYGGGGWNF